MSNEILWGLTLVLNFTLILLAYKFFGKAGLYGWIVFMAIVANIEVLKTVEMFGFVTTTGNILYATSFLITDILSELYGKRSATKAVLLGLFTLFATTLVMQLTLLFTPHASDWASPALSTLFGFMPRVALASGLAYLVSQLHDVWAYQFWRDRHPGESKIWIRNNASTIVSQLIDTAIFCVIAFWNVFPVEVFWSIFWTTYVLKFIVAICDTPFIYIAVWMKKRGMIVGEYE